MLVVNIRPMLLELLNTAVCYTFRATWFRYRYR